MGANGAGKSTLVKVLTGAIRPDAGRILIRGETREVHSPAEARRASMVSVYQEPSLIPELDVASNLSLTDAPVAPFRDWVPELGVRELEHRRDRPRHAARGAPRPRPRPRARHRAGCAAARRNNGRTAGGPRGEDAPGGPSPKPGPGGPSSSSRIVRRDFGAVRRRDGAAGRRDRRRGRHDARRGGAGSRTDARRTARAIAGPRIRSRGVALGGAGARRARRPQSAGGTNSRMPRSSSERARSPGSSRSRGRARRSCSKTSSVRIRPYGVNVEVDGAQVRFAHPADAIRAGIAYVPGDRTEALLMQRSVARTSPCRSAPPCATGPRSTCGRKGARSMGAMKRLEIDTRPQREEQRRSGGNQRKVTIARWIASARAPCCASTHARHRRRDQAGDLSAAARTRRARQVDAVLHVGARGSAARLRSRDRHLRRQGGRRASGRDRRRGSADAGRLRPAARSRSRSRHAGRPPAGTAGAP